MTTPPPVRGILRRLLTPKLRRVDLAVAVLLAALGFAAVVQVRSTQEEGPLATARQEDLVQILDELSNRNDRLRAEVSDLTRTREELTGGSGRSQAAVDEARRRAQLLEVLAGTAPARGPGLLLTLTDPEEQLTADVLLDAVQELRAAGAEAIQLEGPVDLGAPDRPESAGQRVRVVASTDFVDSGDGGVAVDGVVLYPPYRFRVIGDSGTLASAVGIPGGVMDSVQLLGGVARAERRSEVQVDALRRLAEPRYARPAPRSGD